MNPIESLKEMINSNSKLDKPKNPSGIWFLNITQEVVVQWQEGKGFGVFTSPTAYGEGPDKAFETKEEVFDYLKKETQDV